MIDLKGRKKQMESEIQKSVHEILERFSKETGLYPNSVTIEILDTTTYSSKYNECTIGNVRTEVKL